MYCTVCLLQYWHVYVCMCSEYLLVRFRKICGQIPGYSLVLVHYIGTGKLWQIKWFGGLTRIPCVYIHSRVSKRRICSVCVL